ncbi:hypothetical protein [Aurantimicrobium minutum]|uniref:hypothetical protein n=1 Tax=Aurantimicrobium minutum TaxID=708131 RepID=UPI002473EECA|nr:hypothetical protein [Aurantimicrobium minutum]MDH6422289.1 hypothetical protein [Aurantimicrobium minutum]
MGSICRVSTADELLAALSQHTSIIEVVGVIAGMPSITLPPGTELRGGTLRFGGPGVKVTTDNSIRDISIETALTEIAIKSDSTVDSLGTLCMENIKSIGQIAVIAKNSLRSGHIVAKNVWVQQADLRGRERRPNGYGVDVLQGAFTIWNTHSSPETLITATLENISAGTAKTPVRGSGIFVAGGAFHDGGKFTADLITTGEIIIDGGITLGTPDIISGGVFVLSSAIVENVINMGPVTSHGPNDMVLDNWGTVTKWEAQRPITSTGASGIGFVNFGDITTLKVNAPIVTTGPGARGFNLYDGSLLSAVFESIATTGDGSIGVQISKPMGEITILGNLTTTGSVGTSLVKGHQLVLSADALSIKQGGSLGALKVGGNISTSGDSVTTIELQGPIDRISITGEILTSGQGSTAFVGEDNRISEILSKH